MWVTLYAKLLQRFLLIHKLTQSKIAVYNSHFSHENDRLGITNPQLEAAKIEIELIKQDLQDELLVMSGGDRNTHMPQNQDVRKVYTDVQNLNEVKTEGFDTIFIDYENHPRWC